MDIPFNDALNMVLHEADHHAAPPCRQKTLNPSLHDDNHTHNDDSHIETISIAKALNRICPRTICSPHSTPLHDTSAMDGYALSSAATSKASAATPLFFRLTGSIAAGDEPLEVSGAPDEDGIHPCVEIMTGARFPNTSKDQEEPLDCCVRFEEVDVSTTTPTKAPEKSSITNGNGVRDGETCYISITKPARYQQNRRLAGADAQAGDVIVAENEIVRPQHIMALASVGLTDIPVRKKLRVGLFSTGSELLPPSGKSQNLHRIRDVNGPYITALLNDWGQVDVDFWGVLDDNAEHMATAIKSYLAQREYDLVISTGAVSSGRFDLVPAAIQRLGAQVVFHRVAMRPGHPALFAKIPSQLSNGSPGRTTAFFGLPGNPVASAACLRFLAMPYLKRLLSQPMDCLLTATAHRQSEVESNGTHRNGVANADTNDLIATFPADKDVFRPGILHRETSQKEIEVELIRDHSPGKIMPFLGANCWIHIPRAVSELRRRDVVEVFPT